MFMGVASFRSCRRCRALAYGLILAHTLAYVRLHVAFAVLRDAVAFGEKMLRLYHGLARTETRWVLNEPTAFAIETDKNAADQAPLAFYRSAGAKSLGTSE